MLVAVSPVTGSLPRSYRSGGCGIQNSCAGHEPSQIIGGGAGFRRQHVAEIGIASDGPLRPCRKRLDSACALANARGFIVAKDKQFVLNDRTACRKTKLVALQLWSLHCDRIHKVFINRVQSIVAQKFPRASCGTLVGTRFDGCIHHCSTGPPEFRAEVTGLDLEFLDGVRAGRLT